ncbi:uncharacterized protein G2W53_017827 [Senna tora]|uniref:Uncharacterized protein n=1 Tax=Senna tora TaxID=362788 RepID=A0A834TQ59_9FABA|nr:uncharacterized protein G2W53_017827 [Senna tora]
MGREDSVILGCTRNPWINLGVWLHFVSVLHWGLRECEHGAQKGKAH